MEFFETQKKIITVKPKLANPNMFFHRKNFHFGEVFYVAVVLLCALSIIATCEPCSVVAGDQLNSDACRSFTPDVFSVDVTSGPTLQNLVPQQSLDNVCPDSHLFCFRSTLPGFLSPEQDTNSEPGVSGAQSNVTSHVKSNQVKANGTWSSSFGTFRVSSGRTISCSLYDKKGCHELPYHQIKSEEPDDGSLCKKPALNRAVQRLTETDDGGTRRKPVILDPFSPHAEIKPSILDWGQKYLYLTSLAFLTIRNIHSENILIVYEPYSSSSQFYPCNCSEILLAPGETASVCFVFLPTSLGLSSAQLVLQTSSGGFLVHATGFALESPYGIQPLVGLDVPSSGKWRKNLSLFNPFSEALKVEEVTAWISVSSGNTCQLTKAICSISSDKNQGEFSLHSVKGWIDLCNEVDRPVISMKPHRNWEVGPKMNETLIELDFSFPSRAKIFGAFCMRLLRSSKEKIDTIMVPLEAEFGEASAFDQLPGLVSVSLEALMPCEITGTSVYTLSLRNDAPYMLRVIKVSVEGKSDEHFHIKSMEGLMIFPGTVTQVAVVFYTPLAFDMEEPSSESPKIDMNCELAILTNDSRNYQVKIPCSDVLDVCSGRKLNSSVGNTQGSEEAQYGNARTKYSGSAMQSLPLNEALSSAEADELVLKSWKSQGTANGMSVVDDHEVFFPVVRLGSHSSQFVNVKNPSQEPVIMQLILNSGEIVDECKTADELFQPSFSSSLIGNKSFSPSRYGFSIPEGALTEAFVHPYGNASLGPIFFQPSNRCVWKSSVLIRNNLSGVEWLSLRGSGGSLSMVLLEESEPARLLDFKLGLPTIHTLSSSDFIHHEEVSVDACARTSSKELYAKNTGDLPFEVKRIGVSGSECRLDGFLVHTCKGFALEPGETTKLVMTYETDFSVATIQRDLELALATGIFVIPMKASLTMHMLGFCRKSIIWMRVKKAVIAIPLMAIFLILVLFCFLPHAISFGTQDYLLKSRKSSTAGYPGKSSRGHCSQKRFNKFSLSAKMNGVLRSIGEEESLLVESLGRYADNQTTGEEKNSSAKHVKPSLEFEQQTNSLFSNGSGQTLSPLSMLNSAAVKRCDTQETTQGGNLTVKTGKDKGRRRRKKKSSGAGVSGLLEVSSSQSGNSTPSSPLSPVGSFTPKRSPLLSPDVDQSIHARNPFDRVANQQHVRHANSEPKSKANRTQPETPLKPGDKNCYWGNSTPEKLAVLQKMNGKAMLPSATFPSAPRPDPLFSCSPFLVSTSPIAPHARAPGSKLHGQKTVKPDDKEAKEKFTYDIWGDHIFAPPLTGRPMGATGLPPHVTENNSDSFFVRGPQALMTIAESKSVSCSDQVINDKS